MIEWVSITILQGEAAGADGEAVASYLDNLARIMNEGGYTNQQIFNVDKTALYLKMMPFGTFIAKEIKSMPGFKASNDRLNLFLTVNAACYFKLQSMFLYYLKISGPLIMMLNLLSLHSINGKQKLDDITYVY